MVMDVYFRKVAVYCALIIMLIIIMLRFFMSVCLSVTDLSFLSAVGKGRDHYLGHCELQATGRMPLWVQLHTNNVRPAKQPANSFL